jgi:hypothetical protein
MHNNLIHQIVARESRNNMSDIRARQLVIWTLSQLSFLDNFSMSWRIFIFSLSFSLSSCVATKPACLAPARSLTEQAFDVCFLENGTDDIDHPGVQECYSKWMDLPDSCETRTRLKTERCRLSSPINEFVRNASLSECITSMRSEGYLVNGCEYPFTEECISRVNAMAR